MILENIHTPADVKALDREQLEPLCRELRQFLVEHVSKTGGHLASNLGAVELTVAIHRVFDTSKDRLVFDVGHQCYVHKALTGRQALFDTCGSSAASPASPSPGRANTTPSSPDMPPTPSPWPLGWQEQELYSTWITVFWR